MAFIIIEGDPGHLQYLLDELHDRNYLPQELNVKFLNENDKEEFVAILDEIYEQFVELPF